MKKYDCIGIIGAMEEELYLIRKALNDFTVTEVGGILFFSGTLSGVSVVAAVSGIGKVNMAQCATIMILNFGVDLIINTGVAGSLNSYVKPGNTVIASSLAQHDFDLSPLGETIGTIPEVGRILKADTALVEFSMDTITSSPLKGNFIQGLIVSGDQFVEENRKKQILSNFSDALCVEMEGASLAHICIKFNIDFLVIRTISDSADGTSPMDYADFKVLAADKAASLVRYLINEISFKQTA